MMQNRYSAENEQYNDEVLNASWLPQTMLFLSMQASVINGEFSGDDLQDPDDFLNRLYAAQE